MVEVIHSGFNADTVSGGFAFRADRGLMLYSFGGGCMYSVDPGDEPARLEKIDQWWRESQHRDRPLGLEDVNEWHRAAIAALVAGLDSVGDLTPWDRPGVADIARADYVYVWVRRHAREQTQVAALKALAANDWIMEMDGNGDTAHRVPSAVDPPSVAPGSTTRSAMRATPSRSVAKVAKSMGTTPQLVAASRRPTSMTRASATK